MAFHCVDFSKLSCWKSIIGKKNIFFPNIFVGIFSCNPPEKHIWLEEDHKFNDKEMEKVKHSDMKANQEPLLCRLGEVIKKYTYKKMKYT